MYLLAKETSLSFSLRSVEEYVLKDFIRLFPCSSKTEKNDNNKNKYLNEEKNIFCDEKKFTRSCKKILVKVL